MKLRIAELITAIRGESARVETLVAIEFAVSWKPFVKSKKSAIDDDDDESHVFDAQTFLTTMLPTRSAAVSQASIASSSASRMSFQRMTSSGSASFSNRPAIAGAHDPVALVLEPLHLDDVLLGAPQLLEVAERLREVLGHLDEHPALLERRVDGATRPCTGRADRTRSRCSRRRRRSPSRARRCPRGRTA